MQHGTGREHAIDLVENVRAIVGRIKAGVPGALESYEALGTVLEVLESTENLDERGVYGPDYGFDSDEVTFDGVTPFPRPDADRVTFPKVVKYLGPTGSIRDTRPKDLGRPNNNPGRIFDYTDPEGR